MAFIFTITCLLSDLVITYGKRYVLENISLLFYHIYEPILYIYDIYLYFYVFQITRDFKAHIGYLKYIKNTDNSTHKPPRFNIFSLSAPLY